MHIFHSFVLIIFKLFSHGCSRFMHPAQLRFLTIYFSLYSVATVQYGNLISDYRKNSEKQNLLIFTFSQSCCGSPSQSEFR